MTAVLSPTEADETTRFGIHDREAWEQLVEGGQDELSCDRCDRSATCTVITQCCGTQAAHVCEGCRAETQQAVESLVSLGCILSCKVCQHVFHPVQSYAEIFREVTL